MSGINDSIGWNVEFNRPSTAAWQLSGDDLRFSFHNSAAFAFRVEGVSGAVPEPTTWTMLLLGFGMIGFAMRKRSNVRTTVSYA